jgi:hypothetical protein
MNDVAQVVEILLFFAVVTGLAWFAYRVIFRKIYRARHLRELEMNRLIREAAERDRDPGQK